MTEKAESRNTVHFSGNPRCILVSMTYYSKNTPLGHVTFNYNAMASSMEEVSTNASFMDHLYCKICLEIVVKPVQCQNNEHYFCDACITKHLENSETCPMCLEELTVATLRRPSRIVIDLLSQFKKPRCKYSAQGCKEVVNFDDQVSHLEVCGFVPVVCSNEGCGETVPRNEQLKHENELCNFRKVKCDQCQQEMTHVAFKMHPCLITREMDGMKLCLAEIQTSLKQIQEQVKINSGCINECQEIKLCLNTLQEQVNTNREQVNKNSQYIKQNPLHHVNQSTLIFVAGGNASKARKSFEIFNWSTQTWSIYEDVFFFEHYLSFSFPYKDVIMVCGGTCSNRIEYVNVKKDPHTAHVHPTALPKSCYLGKGALSTNEVFTFENKSVSRSMLDPPHSLDKLLDLPEGKGSYGVESINDNIFIFGGQCQTGRIVDTVDTVDTVSQYNIENNTMQNLAPLPYAVCDMATAHHNEDIFIIGGEDKDGKPMSSVFMYNVVKQESKKLPSMLEKRSQCAAVIMDNVIIAMGGYSHDKQNKQCNLKSAEYLVIGEQSWKTLPEMHCARLGATASIQV